MGQRIPHDIGAIADHVVDGHSRAEVRTGPSIASLLKPGTPATPRYGRMASRRVV